MQSPHTHSAKNTVTRTLQTWDDDSGVGGIAPQKTGIVSGEASKLGSLHVPGPRPALK